MTTKQIKLKKKIGRHSATLQGYKNAGAVIMLKFNYKDKILNGTSEIHFMHFNNAMQEYRKLKSGKTMVNLAYRNI